jgi:divalent metal cation (Fe/Co/Zn/Cd) transporter
MDITEAHHIVTDIEKKILEETGITATIHIEPGTRALNPKFQIPNSNNCKICTSVLSF